MPKEASRLWNPSTSRIGGIFDEWIAVLGEDHMWAYEYLQHLTQVVAPSGPTDMQSSSDVAQATSSKEVCLRLLVVAPLETRIQNVMRTYKVADKEARRQVMRRRPTARRSSENTSRPT